MVTANGPSPEGPSTVRRESETPCPGRKGASKRNLLGQDGAEPNSLHESCCFSYVLDGVRIPHRPVCAMSRTLIETKVLRY